MALPLADAADVLRAAGLAVVEYPGWATRARSGSFAPRGLMIHHDASTVGPSPGVPAFMANPANNGAQLWVDTAGTWHLIAAGRMPHAGLGTGWGVARADRGNEDTAGVETDHTIGEPWPAAQLDALVRGTAALCKHYGWNPAVAVCGHKEYAPGRKPDPDGIDMNGFRRAVADEQDGAEDMDKAQDAALRETRNRVMGITRQRWGLWESPNRGGKLIATSETDKGIGTRDPSGAGWWMPVPLLDSADGQYLVERLAAVEAAVKSAVGIDYAKLAAELVAAGMQVKAVVDTAAIARAVADENHNRMEK
ncbi:peptidoglycan recognition protein family protein [Actinokineospora spheciospongiae]|uniref:peptidoglycan recognition protein family protein n=1 Tax=Actinokineospora spheciospongiae TaxID=909613 RepID=UPI000D708EDC|nr:N-acetylmuramoyl-L-alanine amidase [Actinokineospora spheciospongiae]PWW50275.1 N-acetylmuramoyl-L-alanine amidase [Actinokineospora spheciospongiae]